MYGRGAPGRGGGAAGRGVGERWRAHCEAAFDTPLCSAQLSQPPTTPVATPAGSQTIVAYVARAVGADRCTRCAACESACPQGAITVARIVTVDESQCVACGKCVDVCAFDVLALQPR